VKQEITMKIGFVSVPTARHLNAMTDWHAKCPRRDTKESCLAFLMPSRRFAPPESTFHLLPKKNARQGPFRKSLNQ